jgi:glycosyltransferase involved in cell wall biosynthesis
MRVVLVTGSVPPAICGVGDYTVHLADALRDAGVRAEVYHRDDWSWGSRHAVLRELRARTPDLLHLQYPSVAYGKSKVPGWLAWRFRDAPLVVTAHEYGAIYSHPWWYPLPRGLRTFGPFVLRAEDMIFSSEEERERVLRWAPWMRSRSRVLPIGSNIPRPGPDEVRAARRGAGEAPPGVVHFGQLVPRKGLEDVVELARLAAGRGGLPPVSVLGGCPPAERGYGDARAGELEAAGAEVLRDLPPDGIGGHLAAARYAYLPFPDGASPKRTTLLAALDAGCVVLTRHGPPTPGWIRECTVPVDSAAETRERIQALERDPETRARIRRAAEDARRLFSWEGIARRHVDLYEHALARKRKRS